MVFRGESVLFGHFQLYSSYCNARSNLGLLRIKHMLQLIELSAQNCEATDFNHWSSNGFVMRKDVAEWIGLLCSLVLSSQE